MRLGRQRRSIGRLRRSVTGPLRDTRAGWARRCAVNVAPTPVGYFFLLLDFLPLDFLALDGV
jgi:hypothetical protein